MHTQSSELLLLTHTALKPAFVTLVQDVTDQLRIRREGWLEDM